MRRTCEEWFARLRHAVPEITGEVEGKGNDGERGIGPGAPGDASLADLNAEHIQGLRDRIVEIGEMDRDRITPELRREFTDKYTEWVAWRDLFQGGGSSDGGG